MDKLRFDNTELVKEMQLEEIENRLTKACKLLSIMCAEYLDLDIHEYMKPLPSGDYFVSQYQTMSALGNAALRYAHDALDGIVTINEKSEEHEEPELEEIRATLAARPEMVDFFKAFQELNANVQAQIIDALEDKDLMTAIRDTVGGGCLILTKNDRLTLYYGSESLRKQVLERLDDMIVKVKEMPEKEGRKLVYIFVKSVD